jgi:hypothetical protein
MCVLGSFSHKNLRMLKVFTYFYFKLWTKGNQRRSPVLRKVSISAQTTSLRIEILWYKLNVFPWIQI